MVVFCGIYNRRGYGVASRGGVWVTSPEESGSRIQDLGVKAEDKDAANMEEKSGVLSAWTPDPVTGFYKPCNSLDEANPAELRNMVFNQHRVNKPHD